MLRGGGAKTPHRGGGEPRGREVLLSLGKRRGSSFSLPLETRDDLLCLSGGRGFVGDGVRLSVNTRQDIASYGADGGLRDMGRREGLPFEGARLHPLKEPV